MSPTAKTAKKAADQVPGELKESGRRLWLSVIGAYELEVHEELLLREACRVADRLDRLEVELCDEPVTVDGARGDRVANPALVEARNQAGSLAKLLASLRLPSGEEATRPQRRGAARGAYGLRVVS